MGQVLGPPARSLGVQELEPNVHNGDCINVHDTDYLVQALSIRFKLVRHPPPLCARCRCRLAAAAAAPLPLA